VKEGSAVGTRWAWWGISVDGSGVRFFAGSIVQYKDSQIFGSSGQLSQFVVPISVVTFKEKS
jgi:hypothetical protein